MVSRLGATLYRPRVETVSERRAVDGRIGGNLLFGVEVSDIAVDVSGQRIVAAKAVEVDYSIFQIISNGVVLNGIKLVEPALKLERNGQGWNVAQLVKRQQKEADREGPRRPITLSRSRSPTGI